MDMIAYALAAVFPLLVVAAALKDMTSFTIPNWMSAALIVAFFVAALVAGLPLGAIGIAAAVGAGVLVVGMAMFAVNWVGGGDAKLLAACALWMSWPAVLPFLLVTALAGGVLALVLIQLRSDMMKVYLARGPAWLGRLAAAADAPYGLAIAVGALLTFPQSPIVLQLTA